MRHPKAARVGVTTSGRRIVVAALASLLLAVWTPTASAASPTRVLLVGDSLTMEAQNFFNFALLANHRAEVDELAYGATAICDWIPAIQSTVASWHPNVVAFEFIGTSFTPCTHNPATGQPYTGQALINNYIFYTYMTIKFLQQNHVGDVWLEGLPPLLAGAGPALDAAYQRLPASFAAGVHYYPAGNVLAWHWPNTSSTWTAFLPCLPSEPCPASTSPFIQVRSPDTVHFCPVLTTGACPVYSSGAFRYGMSMATPIVSAYHL